MWKGNQGDHSFCQVQYSSKFQRFLKNGENKKRLIILMGDRIIENKVKALVNYGELYFSTDNDCRRITRSLSVREESLVSNQEEADTKLVLHSLHVLNESPREQVIVRSASGDADVLVILLSKMIGHQDKIYLDYGTGLTRKGLWLSNVVKSESKLKAVIGFHAFTGNDYISSFFRKGKPTCWKILEKDAKFVDAFCSLGLSLELDQEVFKVLEEFVSVDVVRNQLFQ